MRKPEVGEVHVIPEDAVATQLVQDDTPVARDADGRAAGGRECELDESDPVAQGVSRALCVDGISQTAVIDRYREGSVVEIRRDVEAGVPHHAEEAVAMIVRVDGGEVVGSRHIAEIEGLGGGGNGGRRRRLVGQLDERAGRSCVSGLPGGGLRSTSATVSRSRSSVALVAVGRFAGLFVLVIGSTVKTRPLTPSVSARR